MASLRALGRHHPPVGQENHPQQPEARFQILQHLRHSRCVAAVAPEGAVADGPVVHQHHPHEHLPVAGLALATLPVGPKVQRPLALEVGRGQPVEDEVGLEGEQVPQPQAEFPLDVGPVGVVSSPGAGWRMPTRSAIGASRRTSPRGSLRTAGPRRLRGRLGQTAYVFAQHQPVRE